MLLPLFEEVADAMVSLVPSELGEWHHKVHRGGIKVWFGSATPSREHYESQMIPRRHIDGESGVALETGFHAENKVQADNDAVLDHLIAKEKTWRKALGPDAVAGPFLGRPDDWRRVSETWLDADLGEPELAIELASRLTDYIEVLEPLLRAQPGR